MLYTSETCCKYSKTHFLTFIFSVFFYLPQSSQEAKRYYMAFAGFRQIAYNGMAGSVDT